MQKYSVKFGAVARIGESSKSGSSVSRRDIRHAPEVLDKERIARYARIVRDADQILRDNLVTFSVNGERHRFTIPSQSYYGNGWKWDAGENASATVHIDPERACEELRAFESGQWKNGFVPHLVYRPGETKYYPGPEIWDIPQKQAGDLRTSGINQPPNLAIAVEYIYKYDPDEKRRESFRDEMLPYLMREHDFLKVSHDSEDSGLQTVFHSWASGRDNSQLWDQSLEEIDLSSIPPDVIAEVDVNRFDHLVGKSTHRPTNEQYYKYIYLIKFFAELGWDYEKIAKKSPFAVKDIVTSSIWAKGNDSVAYLLREAGRDKEAEIYQGYADQTREALLGTWDPAIKQFCDINVAQGRYERIVVPTSGIFMPIFAGAYTNDILNDLLDRHDNPYDFGAPYPIPSTSLLLQGKEFSPILYHRGPVWPYINESVSTGYLIAAQSEKVRLSDETRARVRRKGISLAKSTIDMVDQCGFQEFFNPYGSKAEQGLGFGKFSWTAGSVLKCLNLLVEQGELPKEFFSTLYPHN
jgi:hypothetical protein